MKYINYKNLSEKEIFDAKRSFFQQYFTNDFNNKKMWNHLKELRNETFKITINNLLMNSQHGFRQFHSCVTAVKNG